MNIRNNTVKNYKYERVTFFRIDTNLIQSEGIILKQLNKRYRNKKTVLEYYKCKRGSSKSANYRNGKCKFSGKLTYQIGTEPQYLEIIHPHSNLCSQNNEGSNSSSKKSNTKLKTKKSQIPQKLYKYTPVLPYIYTDNVPIADIKVQLKTTNDSDSDLLGNKMEVEDDGNIISEEESKDDYCDNNNNNSIIDNNNNNE